MLLAPHNGKIVVVIVFHDDALRRMEQNDPAIVEGFLVERLNPFNQHLTLNDTDFMFCYEPDEAAFAAKAKELQDPKAILQWLGRGWVNQPEEQDAEIRVVSLKKT
jgi:hypothetical protein